MRDFVEAAKARPAGVSYGTGGAGTNPHLWMERFGPMVGMRVLHVPYRGAAPALTDLIAGQIDVMLGDVGSALQLVKAGSIRALAVAGATRHPQLPDVPTFRESGFTGLDMEAWHGIAVRRGTPAAVVQRLNAALTAAVADPRISALIQAAGATPAPPISAQEFQSLMQAEIRTWEPVVRSLNIALE
jgi:tripartite-type tricarboxylate transporter receptor subunit TctC